jgi:hypothetical protein
VNDLWTFRRSREGRNGGKLCRIRVKDSDGLSFISPVLNGAEEDVIGWVVNDVDLHVDGYCADFARNIAC